MFYLLGKAHEVCNRPITKINKHSVTLAKFFLLIFFVCHSFDLIRKLFLLQNYSSKCYILFSFAKEKYLFKRLLGYFMLFLAHFPQTYSRCFCIVQKNDTVPFQ